MTEHTPTEEEQRLEPDPFDLPRLIHKRLGCCSDSQCKGDIRYLWLYAGQDSLGIAEAEDTTSPPLSLDSWLAVLDEAATLGVEWLVVSLETESSNFPVIWDIFVWAQQTHSMNVALHLDTPAHIEANLESLFALEQPRTFLFVPHVQIAHFAEIEARGISVRSSDPSPKDMEQCTMPGSMLFVTAVGKLYTCGMVNGDESFCLGDVNTGFFGNILRDAGKPHAVGKAAMKRKNGCAGCPPLVLEDHC